MRDGEDEGDVEADRESEFFVDAVYEADTVLEIDIRALFVGENVP